MATLQPYKKYNAVAYDYTTELPDGWQLLPNIAIFQERKESGTENEENLTISAIRGIVKSTDYENRKDRTSDDKSQYLLVKEGDLAYNTMLMWDGAVGHSSFRGIVSPAYTVLKAKLKINPKFFHYQMRTEFYKNYSRRFSYGIVDARLRLYYVHFKRMYSIVPPLEVQNSIVAYLDKKNSEIDKFIRNKGRLVELLEEELDLFIVQKVNSLKVGWTNKKIKYASTVFRGKFTHRPRNDESLYDGEYPFIQTGDVARAEKYITNYSQTLNKLGYKVTTEFPKGTIVMTIAANIGDVAILGFNACFPDSVVGFYPKKDVLNDFLYYALKVKRNDFLQSAIVNTQMNLNVERVSSVFIDIPSFSEQKNIVFEIEEHEKYIYNAISKAQKEISSIKEYREALITDLVTGKRSVLQLQMN